jgi:curli biogenesis system outer membrane secretion channel CsgG
MKIGDQMGTANDPHNMGAGQNRYITKCFRRGGYNMRFNILRKNHLLSFLAMLFVIVLTIPAIAEEEPVVDNSKTTEKLESLKSAGKQKPVATIYEVRSSVPEVSCRAATDMFTTALIKSHAFAVAERQRLNEGVMREKQLNNSGQSIGTTGSAKLTGAQYIFEATISEANPDEARNEAGVSVGGMDTEAGSSAGTIGLDVRVIDAESGLVVDAVDVRKKIESSNISVAGVGKLAQSLAGLFGKSIPLDPDIRAKTARKESIDKAVRACIEESVYELVRRFGKE